MEDERVSVAWRLVVSGKEGLLKSVPRDVTVGRLSAMLGVGPLAVIVLGPALEVFTNHVDRPFLPCPAGAEARVELVVHEGWASPAKTLAWKDVDARDKIQLASALIRTSRREAEGVRSKMRLCMQSDYVVDNGYVFVRLDHDFDVWCEYLGDLELDGIPCRPLSVWLHSDMHTLLQELIPGEAFAFPTVAARCTSAHICFKLDPSAVSESRGVSLTLEFNVVVGLAHVEIRQLLATSDHVSDFWALSEGCVAWNSVEPRFLSFEL